MARHRPTDGTLADLDGDEACAAVRRILSRKLADERGGAAIPC